MPKKKSQLCRQKKSILKKVPKINKHKEINLYDKSYAAYKKDPKTYTTEEVCKELGIEI